MIHKGDYLPDTSSSNSGKGKFPIGFIDEGAVEFGVLRSGGLHHFFDVGDLTGISNLFEEGRVVDVEEAVELEDGLPEV